jgi:mannose-6-phosphate isomerase-like protein (cupin superfamily)
MTAREFRNDMAGQGRYMTKRRRITKADYAVLDAFRCGICSQCASSPALLDYDRIVKEQDPPLVHAQSADVWVMMAGTATAVTGGELVDAKKNPKSDDASGSSIRGGVEQPLQAGDILYVPPSVPHGFKNVKGFRAYLIRFETK